MIKQSEFLKTKQQLAGQDPLVKMVKLSDIELSDSSIKDGSVHIDGARIPVSNKFFNRLGQAVNLQTGLLNRMNKNEDRDVQTKLLQAVKTYSETRDGGKEFLLIGDAQKHEVGDIVKADKYHRLSNETLFDTAEMMINEVPDMHIESIDHNGSGGVSINLIHGSQVGFEKIGKDEVFRFGVSLVNGNTNSRVDDFFLRLSCANGAVARNLNTAFEFGKGQDAFRELLDSMSAWAKVGFVPRTFQERLETAMTTKASFAELERAKDSVIGQLSSEDPDQRSRIIKSVEDQFFPHYNSTAKRIIAKGHNPLQLSDAQKKFIKTGSTIWDVVNELTWIGSHQSAFDFKDAKRFKVEGGNLFSKTWDLQHAGLAAI
jgi:hypothetical protein